ncbi:hypothetical protein DL93DRAFT_2155919 [Clavulina sp. PMI_390]|nr:hypothetical protein DL93DRAFT_2155919 [Clavulina sp. PMI_390]
MSTMSDSSYVTFPDGDAILRSSDGIEFRIHSFMLRHKSQYFSNMSALYPKASSATAPEPIQLTEGSYVMNTFLLLLYDSSSLPEAKYPSDPESRKELLLAAEKFKFTSRALDRFLLEYLESLEPLRSWALAVRYGLQEARSKACERIINDAIDISGTAEDFPELGEVTGIEILKLQAIQREGLKAKAQPAGAVDPGPSNSQIQGPPEPSQPGSVQPPTLQASNSSQSVPEAKNLEDGTPILFYVRAKYDYTATIAEEFDFQAGDLIAVTSTPEDGWWYGVLFDDTRRIAGRTVFPSNFVELF